MTLSLEDGQLYYKLWLPLLDYVNRKYGVNEKLPQIAEARKLNPNELKAVADKLWDDVSVIDKYLAEHNEVPEDYRNIIKSWKRRIRGRFILERHLKRGSIFISMDNENVYQVSGIVSSWEEMFPSAPLPLMWEVTFMPFKDVIILDGLIMSNHVVFSGNMARTFKGVYMSAKKNGMLHKTL